MTAAAGPSVKHPESSDRADICRCPGLIALVCRDVDRQDKESPVIVQLEYSWSEVGTHTMALAAVSVDVDVCHVSAAFPTPP